MILLERPVFSSEAVDVFQDNSHLTLYMQWKRFADSSQFRSALMLGIEKVKENNLTGWLGNQKHMESILPADEEWATKSWFPLLAGTGLKKMAIVTSLDHFNNVAVKRILNQADVLASFEIRYFVDLKDARDWLFS